MLHGLLNAQWITLHGLIALLGVAFFVIASRVRGQRRHPSAAMAWVISLALMPYVALPLYVLIGNRKVRRSRAAAPAWQAAIGRADTPAARFERLALAMGLPSPARYEQLSIHDNGAVAWQSLQDIMQGAKRTLDVTSSGIYGIVKQVKPEDPDVTLCVDERKDVCLESLLADSPYAASGHWRCREPARPDARV